jgi:hypothetical protein
MNPERHLGKFSEEETMNRRIEEKLVQVLAILFCLGFIVSAAHAAGTQSVTLSPAAFSGDTVAVTMVYDVNGAAGKTTGLGIRIHFNSRIFAAAVFGDLYGEGLVASDMTAQKDVGDLDGDPATDSYIAVAWIGVQTDWPSFSALPLTLGKVDFKIKPGIAAGVTKVNVTTAGKAAGYQFQGTAAAITIR